MRKPTAKNGPAEARVGSLRLRPARSNDPAICSYISPKPFVPADKTLGAIGLRISIRRALRLQTGDRERPAQVALLEGAVSVG